MLDVLSVGSLYGKGVFTTIAVRGGEPFLWDKHWRRLSANAKKLGIELSGFSESATLDSLREKLGGLNEGRVRVAFIDGSSSAVWPSDVTAGTRLQIIVGPPRTFPEHFKLTVSPHRVNTTSPLTGIKSCNYLEQLLAYEEAVGRGFQEAVRLNERGEVTSGCMSNIFWRIDGKLYTPSLATGCLPGTTREHILETVHCKEVEVGIETLEAADHIFLTSAGLGIVPVSDFDGAKLAVVSIA